VKSRLTAGVAVTVLVASGLVVAQAAPVAASVPGSAIDWQPCGDASNPATRLECATVKVPVDWTKPRGPRFDLAIARATATDPAKRIGSLLVNPGGPGGSGVGFALAADDVFSPQLRERFDVVGFDPRGVGGSKAVTCDSDRLDPTVTFYPETAAQFGALRTANRALGQSCRELTGPVFNHVDTTSTVRDMDAVRAALGESKISYYGVSYGTQIGQQYAELFPKRIRAMVIDSNMDHGIKSPQHYLDTSNRAFEGSFRQFAAWCDRTPSCALYGKDTLKVWDALYARAEKGELTDPNSGQPVSAEALRGAAFGSMYDPSAWFGLAADLAAAAGTTARAAARRTAGPGLLAAVKPAHGEPVENSYQAIWCEDWKWNIKDVGQLNRLRKASATFARHTRLSVWFTDITTCVGWPAKVQNPQHRLKVKGAPPILMTTSRWDAATPYEWATGSAKQLPTATLLTYDGVGHGDYWLSPCARTAIDTYLMTKKTPKRGTHCPAVWPEQATARAARAGGPSYPEQLKPGRH
jgi:pimeloyl-ACP methyl ester carboxylesterase